MLGPSVRLIFIAEILSVLHGGNAYAFDPFTVLAAGQAAVGVIETVSGTSKATLEAGEVFSALGEASDEILPMSNETDPYRVARKIQEIERLALEAGYTKDEASEIVDGYRSSNQNLSQAIRLLSRSIRLGKKIASISKILGGASNQAPAVASIQGQNQEKKILTDIYGQMLNSGLDDKKAELERQKAAQEQYKKFRGFVLSLAPGGNLAVFPVDSRIMKRAVEVYQAYYFVLLGLVAAIFFGRVLYYQFSLSGSEKYADLIRDVFTCYFVMLAFPYLYAYMAEFSEALSVRLAQILVVTGPSAPEALSFDKSGWFWWFRPEMLPLILYAFTHLVFNLVLAILIALGPIVILAGTMMNFTVSIPAYFALLLFVWLWPVFWNVLGYFKNLVWADKALSVDGMGSLITSVILFAFQMLSPLAIFSMVKKTHAGQVASGVGSRAKRTVQQWRNGQKEKMAGAAMGAATGGAGAAAGVGASGVMGSGLTGTASMVGQLGGKLHAAREDRTRARHGIQIGKEQFDL